ncbi:helix-turn-helix transcriptional regulator [Bradyrhizobium sp. URHD0069]|uniref:helix-turn-helix domain-containing protein n=1 Tax=Bradyrhizobium sp. URHD0069 TaxID=1380355 RepID=UPI000496F2DF|nr:helix-turn-helix transcriptional regulator [Bradyrhizobium sp. URHD0069]
MHLADWLIRQKVKRIDFAARIGVTPQSITGYCDGDFWPRKEIAQKIFEETGGEVTPTDFMHIKKPETAA